MNPYENMNFKQFREKTGIDDYAEYRLRKYNWETYKRRKEYEGYTYCDGEWVYESIESKIERIRVCEHYVSSCDKEAKKYKRRYSETTKFTWGSQAWGSAPVNDVRVESIYEAYSEYAVEREYW